jgi:hypothetical protein
MFPRCFIREYVDNANSVLRAGLTRQMSYLVMENNSMTGLDIGWATDPICVIYILPFFILLGQLLSVPACEDLTRKEFRFN